MFCFKAIFKNTKTGELREEDLQADCGQEAFDLAADMLEEDEEIVDVPCTGEI